jgi:hypothetical protein
MPTQKRHVCILLWIECLQAIIGDKLQSRRSLPNDKTSTSLEPITSSAIIAYPNQHTIRSPSGETPTVWLTLIDRHIGTMVKQ